MRICPLDGSEHFPRTDPAMIVLVHAGRLAGGARPGAVWPRGRYSPPGRFRRAGRVGGAGGGPRGGRGGRRRRCANVRYVGIPAVAVPVLADARGSPPWPSAARCAAASELAAGLWVQPRRTSLSEMVLAGCGAAGPVSIAGAARRLAGRRGLTFGASPAECHRARQARPRRRPRALSAPRLRGEVVDTLSAAARRRRKPVESLAWRGRSRCASTPIACSMTTRAASACSSWDLHAQLVDSVRSSPGRWVAAAGTSTASAIRSARLIATVRSPAAESRRRLPRVPACRRAPRVRAGRAGLGTTSASNEASTRSSRPDVSTWDESRPPRVPTTPPVAAERHADVGVMPSCDAAARRHRPGRTRRCWYAAERRSATSRSRWHPAAGCGRRLMPA